VPRPDKRIVPGPNLDAPARSSRSSSWTKYGGPETIGGRGAPSEIEATVDDITVIETPMDEDLTKWDRRATAAHLPEVDEARPGVATEIRKEWDVDREVYGRTYRRVDTAVFVEVEVGS